MLSFCTGCGSTAPNSNGQRRPPINLRSRTTFPRIAGKQRPCRDAGVGAIAPGFAMLARAKRASHIDPPASSYAIMRRACPYRGENPGPGKDVHRELDHRPGIRERQGACCDRLSLCSGTCTAIGRISLIATGASAFGPTSQISGGNLSAGQEQHVAPAMNDLDEELRTRQKR